MCVYDVPTRHKIIERNQVNAAGWRTCLHQCELCLHADMLISSISLMVFDWIVKTGSTVVIVPFISLLKGVLRLSEALVECFGEMQLEIVSKCIGATTSRCF